MKSRKLDVSRIYFMGLCALLLTASSLAAFAQEHHDNLGSYLQLSAADIRAKTREIISGSMNFTEDEGKAFWPIYKRYDTESGVLTDQMIALIKDYQANIKSLGDAKAKELAEKVFEIDEQKARLNRKYYREFCKVIPATRVLQFFQLSRRIDTLLSMRIATNLPMIGEDW